MGSVKNWINNGDGFPIAAQSDSSATVCIDPDLDLNSGSLECLDGQDWVFFFQGIFFYTNFFYINFFYTKFFAFLRFQNGFDDPRVTLGSDFRVGP